MYERKKHIEELKQGMSETSSFRVVTYNVHSCRGLDRRVRPERIASVLGQLEASIIALQEVWSAGTDGRERDQVLFIARALGMHHIFGANKKLSHATYGNMILSRWPFSGSCNYDISWGSREPRGCLRADVLVRDSVLVHVFNVHFGLAKGERHHQAERLLSDEILNNRELTGPRIVLGDFNEWKRGRTARLLAHKFQSVDVRYHLRRERTYPGLVPLIHLDHIYYDPALELKSLKLHRSRTSLVASDHLPLIAQFDLRDGVSSQSKLA